MEEWSDIAACVVCGDTPTDGTTFFDCGSRDVNNGGKGERCDRVYCFDCLNEHLKDDPSLRCDNCGKSLGVLAESDPSISGLLTSFAAIKVGDERDHFEEKVATMSKELESAKSTDCDVRRARTLYNELAEDLCDRCPRCGKVFYDYDGCNALRCECGCAFCAICLKDCGVDAHACARSHGNGSEFDKTAFKAARKHRNEQKIKKFMKSHKLVPLESSRTGRLLKAHLAHDPECNVSGDVLKADRLDKFVRRSLEVVEANIIDELKQAVDGAKPPPDDFKLTFENGNGEDNGMRVRLQILEIVVIVVNNIDVVEQHWRDVDLKGVVPDDASDAKKEMVSLCICLRFVRFLAIGLALLPCPKRKTHISPFVPSRHCFLSPP